MKYNKETFTYGYEIEWGDIDRRLPIPEELGTWDNSETDILNLYPPFELVATDPLGIEPYMGGEINTKPTKTWEEQVERISSIKKLFTDAGNTPSSSCVNEGHIHIHVPGLKDDIEGLKRLIKYIHYNQEDTIEHCGKFEEYPDMKGSKNAKSYLKYDIGRKMPEYMVNNILTKSTDFPSFIKMQCAGKNGVSMGRPFRYAINTYCLKHTDTIEFRCFRSTTKENELISKFKFVEEFIFSALNDGKPVKNILSEYEYEFPKFYWDKKEYDAWVETKYPKERGKKIRNYYEII